MVGPDACTDPTELVFALLTSHMLHGDTKESTEEEIRFGATWRFLMVWGKGAYVTASVLLNRRMTLRAFFRVR
jgi:hypothetical protein